jgi:antitoxin component YwqK of YwqJK toxin-antitoxin module
MKKIILKLFMIVFTTMIFCKVVDFSQLEIKDDLYYEIGQSTPFTGTSFQSKMNDVDEIEYIDGERNGIRKIYNLGRLKQLSTYENTKYNMVMDTLEGTVYITHRLNEGLPMEQIVNAAYVKIKFSYYTYNDEEYLIKDGIFNTTAHGQEVNYNIFVDDEKEGKERQYYYSNNSLESENFYRGNELYGESKTYYSNSELKSHGYYENGRKVGVWKFYSEDGTLEKEVKYENGNEVE